MKNTLQMPTATYPAHEDMKAKAQDHSFKYYRLNVKNGFSKMKLDAWKGRRGIKTLQKLHTETREYLNSREARDRLTENARYLFQKRQERSRQSDRDPWERFCHGWSTIAGSRRVTIMATSTEDDGTSDDICRRHILNATTSKCASIKAKDIQTAVAQTEAAFEIVITISKQSLRRNGNHLKLTLTSVADDAGFHLYCQLR